MSETDKAALDEHLASTSLHVTEEEKATWNAKSNFSGDYADLENKPTIPSLDGYATEEWVTEIVGDIETLLEQI